MILDVDNIRLKSLKSMQDGPGREERQTRIGMEETQIQRIYSLDPNAIMFGLIGMSAVGTGESKDRVAVFYQTLGQVNGENCLSMEGDVLRSFYYQDPH